MNRTYFIAMIGAFIRSLFSNKKSFKEYFNGSENDDLSQHFVDSIINKTIGGIFILIVIIFIGWMGSKD
jgi:hypothetical protein